MRTDRISFGATTADTPATTGHRKPPDPMCTDRISFGAITADAPAPHGHCKPPDPIHTVGITHDGKESPSRARRKPPDPIHTVEITHDGKESPPHAHRKPPDPIPTGGIALDTDEESLPRVPAKLNNGAWSATSPPSPWGARTKWMALAHLRNKRENTITDDDTPPRKRGNDREPKTQNGKLAKG